MNAQLELFGHRDLDLRVFAGGAQHADAFDSALGAGDGQLFLAGILAGL